MSHVPSLTLVQCSFLMNSARKVLNETRRQHQVEPGQEVADFIISLPQNVDVCSLIVRVSAGNSAGIAILSETTVVGKLYFTDER